MHPQFAYHQPEARQTDRPIQNGSRRQETAPQSAVPTYDIPVRYDVQPSQPTPHYERGGQRVPVESPSYQQRIDVQSQPEQSYGDFQQPPTTQAYPERQSQFGFGEQGQAFAPQPFFGTPTQPVQQQPIFWSTPSQTTAQQFASKQSAPIATHQNGKSYGQPEDVTFADRDKPIPGIPAIDVVETPDEIRVYAEVPGFDPEEVEVLCDDHTLTLFAQRSTDVEDDAVWIQRERATKFERQLQLPARAVVDDAEATCENGLCTIALPKSEEGRQKRIGFQ